MAQSAAEIRLPSWLSNWPLPAAPASDEACMALAIAFARENVARESGGPFGAVVRSEPGGQILSTGVNIVCATGNPVLHAEVVALSLARLPLEGFSRATLFTSCEPCIMCLGAAHWAGVRRIVCSAHREDAEGIGFREGAGCNELRAEMLARGVSYERGLMRVEARAALADYKRNGGRIYGPS